MHNQRQTTIDKKWNKLHIGKAFWSRHEQNINLKNGVKAHTSAKFKSS